MTLLMLNKSLNGSELDFASAANVNVVVAVSVVVVADGSINAEAIEVAQVLRIQRKFEAGRWGCSSCQSDLFGLAKHQVSLADIYMSSTRCKINLVDVNKWYFHRFCQVNLADFFQLQCWIAWLEGILNDLQPSWIILIGCWDQINFVIGLVRKW